MAKLFVSYSRKDSIAARKLVDALKSSGLEVWVDWEDIPLAAEWLNQIFTGIEEADAFIFLISPDSIASEVCKVEISKAADNNKRIIPIVLRDVDSTTAPDTIRKLNWTFIREKDNFDEGLAKVKTAIELDLDWLEEHRRLQVRSLEWHRKKDVSLLLRGRDLRNAERMVQTYTAKDPIPTELQQKYIETSRKRERTLTLMWIVTGIVVILLSVLSYATYRSSVRANENAIIANNNAETAKKNAAIANKNAEIAKTNEQYARIAQQDAENQREIALQEENKAKAQGSAARAQIYQTRTGELYTSTLLALDSWQKSPSEEAGEILRENISLLPIPIAHASQTGSIIALELNPDKITFLTASSDGTTCIRNFNDWKELFCIYGSTPVNDAIYLRNGKSVMIGYESGLVQVVDAATGVVEQEIKQEDSPVRDLDVKQNGTEITIAYANGKIWFRNIDRPNDKGYPLQIGGTNLISAELSQDGRWFAAGSDTGQVTVWNVSSQKKFNYSHQKGSVLAITFSPGNRYVVSGGDDGNAIGVETETGMEAFRMSHTDSVTDITFFSDGIRYATASEDARVRVWNIISAREELIMFQNGPIGTVEISPDEKWISATGDDTTARIWSTYTGVEMYQIPLDSPGTVLGFASDSQTLLTGNEKGNIGIWDISQMNAPVNYIPFNDLINYSKFSASGNKFIAADAHRVWLLDPKTLASPKSRPPGNPVLDFRNDEINDLVANPKADMIGVSTSGDEYIIYDFKVRVPVKPGANVQALAFTADGLRFITGTTNGLIETWDVKSGKPLHSFNVGDPVLSLAAGPAGVALGTTDKIILLDVNAEQKITEWQSPGENLFAAFNSDGSLLASANSSGQIAIWKQGNNGCTLDHTLIRQQPYSMVFDPQSNTLAVGTVDDVYIIDALNGTEIDRVHHRGNVYDVSFSPDGKTLATASLKVVQLWDASNLEPSKSDDPVQKACSRLIYNFSESEWKVLFGIDEPYVELCKGLPVPE